MKFKKKFVYDLMPSSPPSLPSQPSLIKMSQILCYFVILVIFGFYNKNMNNLAVAAATATAGGGGGGGTGSIPFTTNNNNYFYKTLNNNNETINSNECLSDRLVLYKVVFHAYWTRELFPKHYPDWRPSAQWTKTIGKSHDSSFRLFNIGQPATAGVKQFAETGKSDILDNIKQQQSGLGVSALYKRPTTEAAAAAAQTLQNSIFDDFDIPSIMAGGGRNEGKFFADGQHSLVSLITRIVPSPDWFIGVDSFQLCVGGTWIDSVTIDQDPLDAGTDNGFTFTAPNWPTEPQGVIYRITSRYPAHPAGSFFYPKSKRLPPIATFQFIKLKEYELSEVFNFEEDERKYEMVKTRTHLETEHNHVEMNNELSANIEKERQNELLLTVIPIVHTEKERVRAKLLAKMNISMNNNNATSNELSKIIPKNQTNAIFENIQKNYAMKKHKKYRKHHYNTNNNKRRTQDCRVGHWSDWTACSKTCGIGEMHKYRQIIKHPKRNGRPCPPLQQSKWCGTSQTCHTFSATYNNMNW